MKKIVLALLIFINPALTMDRWRSWTEITGYTDSSSEELTPDKLTLSIKNIEQEKLEDDLVKALFLDNDTWAQELLLAGANPNSSTTYNKYIDERLDAHSDPILLMAAEQGNETICSLLLAHGADANATNIHGRTALMIAAKKGKKSLCRILQAAGATHHGKKGITIRTPAPPPTLMPDGTSKLSQSARRRKRTALSKELVRKALYAPASEIQQLIAQGAWVNKRDAYDNTPLIHATHNKEGVDICKMLLAAGANIYAQNKRNDTPLLAAALLKKESICRLIVDQQEKHTRGLITALLFFKHHENPRLRVIYQQKLLKPYLENYTLKPLLNAQDTNCKRPYNHLKVDFLKPALYAHVDEPLDQLFKSYLDFEFAMPDQLEQSANGEKIWHH